MKCCTNLRKKTPTKKIVKKTKPLEFRLKESFWEKTLLSLKVRPETTVTSEELRSLFFSAISSERLEYRSRMSESMSEAEYLYFSLCCTTSFFSPRNTRKKFQSYFCQASPSVSTSTSLTNGPKVDVKFDSTETEKLFAEIVYTQLEQMVRTVIKEKLGLQVPFIEFHLWKLTVQDFSLYFDPSHTPQQPTTASSTSSIISTLTSESIAPSSEVTSPYRCPWAPLPLTSVPEVAEVDPFFLTPKVTAALS
eukprot:TRINITY_DN497_c0_g2_i1.p1 TRINITY_DN497_c0_g2~~TRINITY_DN497_c0_g2_i1.p1  ORF type:complete len:250 (+),score=53.45 TRINITY_DN497_c0_g2_i1:454-1203(+)